VVVGLLGLGCCWLVRQERPQEVITQSGQAAQWLHAPVQPRCVHRQDVSSQDRAVLMVERQTRRLMDSGLKVPLVASWVREVPMALLA
jgi:hypothetical protein